MKNLTMYVILALAAALSGCGPMVVQPPGDDGGLADAPWSSDAPAPTDRPPAIDVPSRVDVPVACTRSADCARGQECLGGEGCAVPWTCQPAVARPCTADYAPFCGCDGTTFRGSSSCPDRPYAHRGECATPVDGGPAGCALPDGRVCGLGETCRIGECATCFCGASGELRCTMVPCVDAGTPRTCSTSGDCPAGTLCVGPDGCGVPWTCQSPPPCTRDLAYFCACDGTTFRASSTCPGRPFAYRGPCGIVPPPVDAGPGTCVIDGVTCRVGVPCRIDECTTCTCSGDSVGCSVTPGCGMDGGLDAGGPPPICPAQDARGVGNCERFFGYAWNGSGCVGISGCSCAGADCRSLPLDPTACELAHRLCPRPI